MPTLSESRRSILDAIGPHPQMAFVRPFGNFGDEMIWSGTRSLLRDHVHREISVDELCAESGELAVISGGGAWSARYSEYMPEVLAIAEQRFERVVVLPSTFDCSVDRVRRALSTTNAVVFARELESLEQIRHLCDARLAHDCAFFCDLPIPPRHSVGTLNAFRTDGERRGDRELPADNVDLSAVADSLDDWFAEIAAHEVVNTDRAHVMIAAARMGRTVNYASSSYFKVDALATSCLADYDVAALPAVEADEASSETHPDVTLFNGRLTGEINTPYLMVLGTGQRLLPGALDALVDALDADPTAIAATPAFVNDSGEVKFCGGWPLIGAADFRVAHDAQAEPVGWAPSEGTLIRVGAEAMPSEEFTDAACRAADWAIRLRGLRQNALVRVPEAQIQTRSNAIPETDSLPSRAPRVARLSSHALLHARHQVLLRDELLELVPELRDAQGELDADRARLLLAAVRGKGSTWVLGQWMNGGLAPLMEADALTPELRERLAWLEQRNAMLEGIEQGRWWALRARLSPLRRLLGAESAK